MNTDPHDPTHFSSFDEIKKRTPRPDELSQLDDYYREDERYMLFPPPAQENVLCMKVDEFLLDVPDDLGFLVPAAQPAKNNAIPAVPTLPISPQAVPPLSKISPRTETKDGNSYSYRRRRAQRAVVSDPWSSEADKAKARVAARAEEGTSRLMQLSQFGRKHGESGSDTFHVVGAPLNPLGMKSNPAIGANSPAMPPASDLAPPAASGPVVSSYHKRRMQRALDPWRSAEHSLPSETPLASSGPEMLPFASAPSSQKKEPPTIRNVQQPQSVSMPVAVRKRSEYVLQRALKPNLGATVDDSILLPLDFDDDTPVVQATKRPEHDGGMGSEEDFAALLFPSAKQKAPLAWDTVSEFEQGFLLPLENFEGMPKENLSAGLQGVPRMEGMSIGGNAADDSDVPFDLSALEIQIPGVASPAEGTSPVRSVPSAHQANQAARAAGHSAAQETVTKASRTAGNSRKVAAPANPLISDANALPSLRPRTTGLASTSKQARTLDTFFDDALYVADNSKGEPPRPHAELENRRTTLAAAARSSHPSRPRRRFNMVDANAEAAANAARDRWKGVSLVDDDPVAGPAEPKGWGDKIISFLGKVFSRQAHSLSDSPRKNLLAFSYGALKNTDFNPKQDPKLAPRGASSAPHVTAVGATETRASTTANAAVLSTAALAATAANAAAPATSLASTGSASRVNSPVPEPAMLEKALPLEETSGFETWDDADDDEEDSPLWTPPSGNVSRVDMEEEENYEEYDEAFLLEELAQMQNNTVPSNAHGNTPKKSSLFGWLSHLFKGDAEGNPPTQQ